MQDLYHYNHVRTNMTVLREKKAIRESLINIALGQLGQYNYNTNVVGAGSGSTGAIGTTATANAAAAMGATVDAGAALPEDATGPTGTGTSTVIARNGVVSAGSPRVTETSKSTAAMVEKTNVITDLNTGITSQANKKDKTQATISLPEPKASLAKELYKTPTHQQRCLAAQLQKLLLQDSPDLTKLNGAGKKPVVGIINIPKSSTTRVLQSFVIGTNPIVGSYPITSKILSIAGYGSYANPTQAKVIPMKAFHKTSIWVPHQDDFEQNITNTHSFSL